MPNYKHITLAAFICFFLSISFLFSQETDDRKPRKQGREGKPRREAGGFAMSSVDLSGNIVLGCPTDNSVVINIILGLGDEVFAEYSIQSGTYNSKTGVQKSNSGEPVDIKLDKLQPNTCYFYRVSLRKAGSPGFIALSENSFYTQRSSTSSFSFGIQGDSHPERVGKMFNADLYHITMRNVAQHQPDFYFMLGDDFSIERLIENKQYTPETVDEVYRNHRQYLGAMSGSTPLFLVNGNHEQAARYLLDGTASNPAVLAANSRNKFYPLPAPDKFYSGNSEPVQHVGLLRDYYAFEWGNALFVVIDFYWHSDSVVDNKAGKRDKSNRNPWGVSLGNTQYQWFKSTLENSKAKYKFVFTHHVLGTGRGGVENAGQYEWGGKNRRGDWEFDRMRPNWKMPIHQLMVANHVTIFFQGHDHLFCKQELDGIVYQSVPIPADDTYTTFNAEAYSGDKLPNSGFLNVSVSPKEVKVDYIRSFLPKDETDANTNNSVAFSYVLK